MPSRAEWAFCSAFVCVTGGEDDGGGDRGGGGRPCGGTRRGALRATHVRRRASQLRRGPGGEARLGRGAGGGGQGSPGSRRGPGRDFGHAAGGPTRTSRTARPGLV